MTLTDKWRDGVRTFHGLSVHGFPNCFVLSIAQSGFTVNFPYLLDVQATPHGLVIAWGLNNDGDRAGGVGRGRSRRGSTRSSHGPAASAERAKSCTPGYYNREGQANAKTRQGSFFFGSPTEYADILEASRANGLTGGIRGLDDSSPPIPGRSDAGVDADAAVHRAW